MLPRHWSIGCLTRQAEQLRVKGHTDLFAVGDCAVQEAQPWVPRAGVYAVRQGPVLERNLRAVLERAKLEAYQPQRDYLSLLNLGGGVAIGSKWVHNNVSWALVKRRPRKFGIGLVLRHTTSLSSQNPRSCNWAPIRKIL